MKAALTLTLSALLLSACVPSSTAPASAPAPVARPAPKPAPPPVAQAPASDSWMDVPSTPGDWRYAARGTGTEASFWSAAGAPMLRLRCMADTRNVVLSLPESGARNPLVTIRTETTTRTFEAQPAGRETLVALTPGDPLLDAMALSKGRFAVESDGLPTLLLPSWAEVSRVIEDCR
ncbi:MAG: hypothetical protein RIT17_265 [Pseudomonadota bacterium]